MNNVNLAQPKDPIQPPIQPLPPVNIPVSKNAEIQKRVEEVAKPVFKEYQCWTKFCNFFKNIGLWFKEIPTKIANAFKSCFLDENEEDDEDIPLDDDWDENLEDEYEPYKPIQPQANVNIEVLQNLIANFDRAVLTTLLRDMRINGNLIAADTTLMKFKTIEDLDILNRTQYEISEHLLQISTLKQLIENPQTSQEIKAFALPEIAKLAVQFEAAQYGLLEKIKLKKDKIEKLKEDLRMLNINGKDKVLKKVPLPQALQEDSRNVAVADAKDVPPAFFNRNNNCWFHAVLELFWKIGPEFHQMVLEKENERPALQNEYEENKRVYERDKANYEAGMVAYREGMRKLGLYRNALRNYVAERDEIEKLQKVNDQKLQEFKAAANLYLEEVKKWEEGGKVGAKPIEPQEPVLPPVKALPEEPVKVATPRKPWKPELPANPVNFLDTLKQFSEVLQFGTRPQIREVSDNLHHALINYHVEFKDFGIQHDASAAVGIILDFISKPLFQMEERREGLPDTQFAGYKQSKISDHKTLQLQINGNNPTFQGLLDEYFKKHEINDPDNAPRMQNNEGDEKDIAHHTEKLTIKNPVPPDFMIVELKRFSALSKQQQDAAREAVENKRKELIGKHTEVLKKKEEFKDKDDKIIETAATQELTKQRKLPVYVYDPGLRKIDTPVIMPDNLQLNFSKAFGLEVNDPNYEYVIESTIIHRGRFGGGHYVANVIGTNPKNGQPQWYHADDIGGRVYPLTLKAAINNNQQGYIFLVKKVNKPANENANPAKP